MPLKSLEVPSRRAARFAAVGYDAEVAHPAADRPPIGGSDHLRDSREWPEQPGLADFGGERRVRACGAKRSPCSPGSASTTTPAWKDASIRAASKSVLNAIARGCRIRTRRRGGLVLQRHCQDKIKAPGRVTTLSTRKGTPAVARNPGTSINTDAIVRVCLRLLSSGCTAPTDPQLAKRPLRRPTCGRTELGPLPLKADVLRARPLRRDFTVRPCSPRRTGCAAGASGRRPGRRRGAPRAAPSA